MLGRSLRKLISALLMIVAAQLISGQVDMTPVIGSPQIDYPFNYELPFWPQLIVSWVAVGGGSALLVALGMYAWGDEPVPVLSFARTAMVAVSWFAIIGGLKLAGFLAWGTMGPLYVQQPIFRFALVNGLISSALVTLMWLGAGLALRAAARLGPWRRGAWIGVGTGATFSAAILAAVLVTGLPLPPQIAFWWPFIAFLGSVSGLLASLTWRGVASAP